MNTKVAEALRKIRAGISDLGDFLAGEVLASADGTILFEEMLGNTTLTRLNLGNCAVGVGFRSLAASLRANNSLVTLYLGGNDIGDAGALLLGEILEFNRSLRRLDLQNNSIGVVGARALAGALKDNISLTSLLLFDNKVGPLGAQAFANAMKSNVVLTTVGLHGNAIGDVGFLAVAEALKINSSVTELYVGEDHISASSERALENSLGVNSSLITDLFSSADARSLFEMVLGGFVGIQVPLDKLCHAAIARAVVLLRDNRTPEHLVLAHYLIGNLTGHPALPSLERIVGDPAPPAAAPLVSGSEIEDLANTLHESRLTSEEARVGELEVGEPSSEGGLPPSRQEECPQPPTALVHFSGAEIETALSEGRLIGTGGFGDVTRTSLRGMDVAVKVLKALTPSNMRTFQRELDVQGTLRHERILPIIGTCLAPVCLVSPFLGGGDLRARLDLEPNSHGYLSGPLRVELVRQVVEGLVFLHGHGVVHGDIKPQNILFDSSGSARLADAGLAIPLPAGASHLSVSRLGGTPGYMDPEIVLGNMRARPAQDMYALGAMITQIISGALPGDRRAVARAIDLLEQRLEFMWETPAWAAPRDLSSALRLVALARRCVGPCADRPSAAEALMSLEEVPTVVTPSFDAPAPPECAVCMERPRRAMFLPCRHAVTCENCASALLLRSPPLCPTCRGTIVESVLGDFYMSFMPPI